MEMSGNDVIHMSIFITYVNPNLTAAKKHIFTVRAIKA